jgi:hypothetical protein
VDARDLMNPEASKWNRISQQVMRAGHSTCMRDGPACKAKWNQLLHDYKKIADFHACTGYIAADYWDLFPSEHTLEGLPKIFAQDLFLQIDEWYRQRPQIAPPHIRDLLSPHDGNHPGVRGCPASHDNGTGDSDAETDDLATLSKSHEVPSTHTNQGLNA